MGTGSEMGFSPCSLAPEGAWEGAGLLLGFTTLQANTPASFPEWGPDPSTCSAHRRYRQTGHLARPA